MCLSFISLNKNGFDYLKLEYSLNPKEQGVLLETD
jgi:hypothetical protein